MIEAPRFDELEIEGVLLSIRPDFLVQPANGRVGAGIIRVAKAPDPADCKQDETKRSRMEHRRELARYMIAMFHMLLEDQNGAYGIPERFLQICISVSMKGHRSRKKFPSSMAHIGFHVDAGKLIQQIEPILLTSNSAFCD